MTEQQSLAETTVKRFAVLAAAAGLSTWAIDSAATQVGLPSMQVALGISVTASQSPWNSVNEPWSWCAWLCK